jgi:hypothetical protein
VCAQSSGRRQLGRGMAGATRQCGWPRRRLESMAAGDFGADSGPTAHGCCSLLNEEGGMLAVAPVA